MKKIIVRVIRILTLLVFGSVLFLSDPVSSASDSLNVSSNGTGAIGYNPISAPMLSDPEPTPLPKTEGWTSGETSVSNLSLEEKKCLLGVPDEVHAWEAEHVQAESPPWFPPDPPPPSIDWRNHEGEDWTTPIRNQSNCGSCVAFATIAAIESRLEKNAGDPDLNPDLSESHLFFCGCGNCCQMGWYPFFAINYAQYTGIVDEECDPYNLYDRTCSLCQDWRDRVTRIQRWYWGIGNIAIKHFIAESGPVEATMDVYEDFYYYRHGVYSYRWGGYLGRHAVTIVGYDDVGKYWIVKNSWGSGWGEGGWFRIAYGAVGIDNLVYIPEVPDPAPICNTVTEIPEKECRALASLYRSTNGEEWKINNGWLETNKPCNWYGVHCQGGNVVELLLRQNGLQGALPPLLDKLTALNKLYLPDNDISGSIPQELGDLSELTWLVLNNNRLSGMIPSELGKLENLLQLSLSGNELTGSIPPELGELSNLSELRLQNNRLSGVIPSKLGKLENLLQLSLSGNELTGSIPTELGELSNLSVLRLQNNRLSGSIPTELSRLSRLEELTLQNNALRGDIPPSLASLTNLGLGRLDLGYNALTTSDSSLIEFLEKKDPDWWKTQTVPPTEVIASLVAMNKVELTWKPIPYTGDGGYYKIWIYRGSRLFTTGQTSGKDISIFEFKDRLRGHTYTFKLTTFTPAHGEQANALMSDYSEEVVISMPGHNPIY